MSQNSCNVYGGRSCHVFPVTFLWIARHVFITLHSVHNDDAAEQQSGAYNGRTCANVGYHQSQTLSAAAVIINDNHGVANDILSRMSNITEETWGQSLSG